MKSVTLSIPPAGLRWFLPRVMIPNMNSEARFKSAFNTSESLGITAAGAILSNFLDSNAIRLIIKRFVELVLRGLQQQDQKQRGQTVGSFGRQKKFG